MREKRKGGTRFVGGGGFNGGCGAWSEYWRFYYMVMREARWRGGFRLDGLVWYMGRGCDAVGLGGLEEAGG